MSDRGTQSSSRYDGNEQAAEPEDDEEEDYEYDNDEGAGDPINAHAEDEYDEYDNDGPSDNLALVQLMRMRSALLESLPAKARARLLDCITKAEHQFPVGSPDNAKYNTVDAQVAKAFINSLPEKIKAQFFWPFFWPKLPSFESKTAK